MQIGPQNNDDDDDDGDGDGSFQNRYTLLLSSQSCWTALSIEVQKTGAGHLTIMRLHKRIQVQSILVSH